MTKDPKIRLFKEISSDQKPVCRFKGKKAFVPLWHRIEGVRCAVVAEVEYGDVTYRVIPDKRFDSFERAELAAEEMNQKAQIPEEVSWAVWESIKNADV